VQVSPGYGAPMIGRLLAVFAGGCAGGLARYAVMRGWSSEAGEFPWAVLLINCSGALLLGAVLTGLSASRESLRALLGPGFCGAWTTFSAITVTVDQLVSDGHPVTGLVYLGASAVGGLVAVCVGMAAGRRAARC
jgi:CrcB protein